jgi:uncharacterized protein YacL
MPQPGEDVTVSRTPLSQGKGGEGAGPNRQVVSNADAMARQRNIAVQLVRAAFVVLVTTVTIVYVLGRAPQSTEETTVTRWLGPALVAFGLAASVLLLDVLTPRKRIAVVSAVFFGTLAGIFATSLVSLIIDLFVATYADGEAQVRAMTQYVTPFKILVGIGLSYLGITTILQTQDELRLVIPYVEFAKTIRGPRPLLLDSSALIDGRVLELAGSGIIQVPIVVPKFVLDELQTLADQADRLKRSKGRRGLEIVGKLQRAAGITVMIDERPVGGVGVDQMLMELARTLPAMIVTTDAGLARNAKIQSISTLNLHEVAIAMKPVMTPGTALLINIIRIGEQPGQGVGYLDDGTMIVVDQGAEKVGEDVRVEITGNMQTAAGRLLFAKLEGASDSKPRSGEAGTVRVARAEVSAASDEPESEAQPTGNSGLPPTVIAPPTGPVTPTRTPPITKGPIGPADGRKTPNRNPRRD